MKINKIAAICKKSKQVVIYRDPNDYDAHYIGDSHAIYLVTGLPELDKNGILTIFDVPEDKKEEWIVNCTNQLEINLDDADPDESIINRGNLSIYRFGERLIPLKVSSGMVFMNSKYLTPTFDSGYTELYERRTKSGNLYIAVKVGMILQAVIFPENIIDEVLVEQLEELEKNCKYALELKNAATENSDIDHFGLRIDPDTGEIIDPDVRPGSEAKEGEE